MNTKSLVKQLTIDYCLAQSMLNTYKSVPKKLRKPFEQENVKTFKAVVKAYETLFGYYCTQQEEENILHGRNTEEV